MSSADGNWKIVVHSPMGAREIDFAVKTHGDTFTARAVGDMGENDVEGQVNGDVLTWKASITNPVALDLEFEVAVKGDEMEGTVGLGSFGSAKVTGQRV